jgi:tetratricopeptide (TPR) repeat protein
VEGAENELARPQWPSHPRALFDARWRVDTVRGRYRKATAELEEDARIALKERDSRRAAEDLYGKARVFLLRDDVAGSREAAAEAHSINPHRPNFRLLLQQGDIDGAAVHPAPIDGVLAQTLLAAARNEGEGRLPAAISEYELAARSPSVDIFATFAIGRLHLKMHEPRKAIEALRRYQAQVPLQLSWLDLSLVRSYLLLGRAYEEAKDPVPALDAYRRVLRMWSDADPDLKELTEVRARVAVLERIKPGAIPVSARP